jgi:hypothetical protein
MRMLGRRGAFLLAFGMVWGLIGYGQISAPPPDQRGLHLLLDRVPLEVWGWLWITAGVVAIVSAFLPQGSDRFGFLALSLIVTAVGHLLPRRLVAGRFPQRVDRVSPVRRTRDRNHGCGRLGGASAAKERRAAV